MDFFDFKPETIQTVVLMLFLVMPGFIFNRIRGASVIRQSEDEKTSLFSTIMASIVFSTPCAVIALMYEAKLKDLYKYRSANLPLLFFAAVFIWPSVAGLAINYLCQTRAWVWLRDKFALRATIPKSWDYFFNKRVPCLMIVTLSNDTKIGGLYSGNSFASSYPATADIYLQQKAHIDNNGQITGLDERSIGVWIDASNIKHIQMYSYIVDINESENRASVWWSTVLSKLFGNRKTIASKKEASAHVQAVAQKPESDDVPLSENPSDEGIPAQPHDQGRLPTA